MTAIEREQVPPSVHGVARLAAMAYSGCGLGDLLDLIGPEPAARADRAAWLMDRSWAHALAFAPDEAELFQQEALASHRVFRIRGAECGPRLLALMAPGDLMANAPLDFITGPARLRLDLAFVTQAGVPALLPDHDVAMVAASESAPETLAILAPVFGQWARPILNDPARIQPMSRTWLPRRLAGLPGVSSAPARVIGRIELAACAPLPYSVLLRPAGSHAGHGLTRADTRQDVDAFLKRHADDSFIMTRFVDYRGPDGRYRKYRIAFVDGRPFICHMAASERWMVHYLNAGMTQSADKRAAEASAMAEFDHFIARHANGLAALSEAVGLDYFSIDCAQTPDGQLLVFEADTAAIIHSMDPPDLFPYKAAVMQLCYDEFAAMVARRTVH